jgi:hypothetical protein
MDDIVKLQNALSQSQVNRLNRIKQQVFDASVQQQFSAKVIGYEDGLILVSINQGGALQARALSNGNFAVGDIVSYFRADGESVGFVDKLPSG